MAGESSDQRSFGQAFSLKRADSASDETRPALSDQQLFEELVASLRARQSAADHLEEQAASALGVHRTAARCVEILLTESPLSAGELAERVGVSRSGTTPLLDRLEEAGVIQRRRASDEDRRRVVIELTTVGRTIAQQFWDDLLQRLVRLTQQYTYDELEVVHDFLARANAILGGREPLPPGRSETDGSVSPTGVRPPTLSGGSRKTPGSPPGTTLGSRPGKK